MSHRRLPTTVGQTLWPLAASAFTRLRRLRVVHNSGCIGSPRVVGSTKLLRSTTRVGSSDDFFFRPPPGLRTRPDGAETWRGEPDVADQRAGAFDDLSWTCRHS